MYYDNDKPFAVLTGKTIARVEGAEADSDEVRFYMTDGTAYRQYHSQDCCESVLVAEVVGVPSDLVGQEVVEAREDTNVEHTTPEDPDSWTWTFYTIRTNRDTVVIRWLGESNGYYGEEVGFEQIA